IAEYEIAVLVDHAGLDGNRLPEHRAVIDKGMELAIFAAGIDGWRQIRQKPQIKFTPGKSGIEGFPVDTRQTRLQAAGDHFSRKRPSGQLPQRKHRLETSAR